VFFLQNLQRLFTKLTLIPLHAITQICYSIKNEKKVWEISNDQYEKLLKKWENALLSRTSPAIRINDSQTTVIQYIKKETKKLNQNNLTRTAGYFSFFQQNPEIIWSFLAHMVSRNAGYFMTDLKGEFLDSLIKPADAKALYSILEQGNSMIFQDAYPQLLLYKESKRAKRSLFHLSRHFNISPFMEGVWELFFEGDDSHLLPIAQIINEQKHIEHHLIKTKQFQYLKRSLPYRIQNWLQLSQVLFPVVPLKNTAGKSISQFDDINNRITVGKHLYWLLSQKQHFSKVFQFAAETPHSASRSDYAPHLFSINRLAITKTKEKLTLFKVKNNEKIYSPKLEDVWTETYNGPFFSEEWFSLHSFIRSKLSLSKRASPKIWFTYWASLHKTESVYLLNKYYQSIKKRTDSKVR
jgi:hypothetical protein